MACGTCDPDIFFCDLEIEKVEYLGNYPKEKAGNWTHKLQGISYSNNYWYLTQEETLWKVSINTNLNYSKNLSSSNSPGLKKISMPKKLKEKGYNHFGDQDNFDGFIFIPIEGYQIKPNPVPGRQPVKVNNTPIIGVFNEVDLSFVDHFELKKQTHSGWCSVNPITKNLYTSNNVIDKNNPIFVYEIDWNILKNNKNLILDYIHEFALLNLPSSWNKKVKKHLQGGDFSNDGCFLVLINGKLRSDTKGSGISVYRNLNHRSGSFDRSSTQKGVFRYQFNPKWSKYEEPEGITFSHTPKDFNLDIPIGNLHAILLDKDAEDLIGGDNEVYIKHYNFEIEE